MKKIHLLIFSLLMGLTGYANPIALPAIGISELYFEESGDWKLELEYIEGSQDNMIIDSIFLSSITDTVELTEFEFSENTNLLVITEDSLDSDFTIARYGDTIKVVSYSDGEAYEDILIFGNLPGSVIHYPGDSQSICKYYHYFVKDKSPTISRLNDTAGIFGTLKGIVYDKYSEPVKNRTFCLYHCFETSANGDYSVRVYSRPTVLNKIAYEIDDSPTGSASIQEIAYTMEPDSTIELDIHLTDTLATGINTTSVDEAIIRIYPNPVSKNSLFNARIDLPVLTSDIWIEIVDVEGKLIREEQITQKNQSIRSPTKSGLYLITLWLDNQLILSKRMLVE